MAEPQQKQPEEEDSIIHNCHVSQYPPSAPAFMEVTCKCSGKVRRFAAGTEAKFAVSVMNRKLEIGSPLALHIQAVKEGEEPVSFGPNALLVDYGNGWKLETVIQLEGRMKPGVTNPTTILDSSATTDFVGTTLLKKDEARAAATPQYFGRIFVALLLIFSLGALFTLALENLPQLILYINASM